MTALQRSAGVSRDAAVASAARAKPIADSGLLLGYLFYRSGLVPRGIAILGLIGGPMIFASAIAVLFGAYEQDGAHFLFSIPEIAFEASITIYTIVKGFKPSPILDDSRYPEWARVS